MDSTLHQILNSNQLVYDKINIWKYVIKEGNQGYKVYKVMRSK